MYDNRSNQAKAPENTAELLKYIAKKIPERLLKALPLTIIIGVVSWLLHTYLLVVTNEGFNPGTWLGQNLLNVKGSFISSTLLWTMVGAIIPIAISFFARGGNPIKSIGAMAKIPSSIIKKNKATQNAVLPMVLISCSVALLFDKLLSGVAGLVAGGILMSSLVSFVTGGGSIFIQIFRMAFTDVQSFVLKKQKMRLDGDSIYLIIGSSGLALLIYGVFKSLNVFPFIFSKLGALIPFLAGFFNVILIIIMFLFNSIWFLLLVLGIVLLVKNRNVPKTLIFFAGIFFAAVAADRILGVRIFADDGGWAESGATFGGWITSEGALPAVLSGLPPALGGIIGSYVSSILSGLFGGFGPIDPNIPVYPQDPTQQDPQTPTPQDPVTPSDGPPLTEADKLRLQQEELERLRLQQEFEAKRQLELQKQQDIRNRALEEKRKLEEQRAQWEAKRDQLCKKYNTTPDKLMDVLRANNASNQADAERLNNVAKNWDYAYKAAVVTLAVSDAAIDGLATVTGPYGKVIRGTYKVVQGVAVGGVEASLKGESVEKGMLGGLVKGGTSAGTDFIGNGYVKAGVTVLGETAAGAITGGTNGAIDGAKNGIYNAGVGAITDKLGGKGFGNEVSTVSQAGGKTALTMTTSTGNVVTKTVSTDVANQFIKGKITNQVIQSGVKGTGAVVSELGVKPVLQGNKILSN